MGNSPKITQGISSRPEKEPRWLGSRVHLQCSYPSGSTASCLICRVPAKWVLVLSSFFRQGKDDQRGLITCLRLHNCMEPRTFWLPSLWYTVASHRQEGCKAIETLQAWLRASPSRTPGTTALPDCLLDLSLIHI